MNLKVTEKTFNEGDSPIVKPRRVRETGIKTIWTDEMCRMLIAEIETKECLWNVKCKDFNNCQKRQLAWKEVSSTVGVNIEEVKHRWYSFRNAFPVS